MSMDISGKSLMVAMLLGSALTLGACGGSAPTEVSTAAEAERTGPWKLDREGSYFNYTTIKADEIAEPNTFRSMDGAVSEDGQAQVTIVLDSIWTNAETRDVRMRQFVFKTDEHPYAVITSQIDMPSLVGLEPGARTSQTIEVDVELAGASASYDADVIVTRIGPNTVSVESRTPIAVRPKDFGVQEAVDYLQELAALPSITPLAPVNFSLVFTR